MTTTIPQPTPLSPTPAGESGAMASVSKAVLILEALNAAGGPVGVSALARRTGIPKPTAFRLLSHLSASGLVARSGSAYELGRKLFELGNRVDVCRPQGVRDVALPYLTDLHRRTGLTVHLAVLDGTDVVYLAKVAGLTPFSVPSTIGGRNPATCTALGKVLLAHSEEAVVRRALETGLTRRTPYSVLQPGMLMRQLAQIRATGTGYDREESQLGLTCVAAPIFDDHGITAALSVSAPAHPDNEAANRVHVRRAAHAVSDQLQSVALAA